MTCPHCGTDTPPGAAICATCGAPRPSPTVVTGVPGLSPSDVTGALPDFGAFETIGGVAPAAPSAATGTHQVLGSDLTKPQSPVETLPTLGAMPTVGSLPTLGSELTVDSELTMGAQPTSGAQPTGTSGSGSQGGAGRQARMLVAGEGLGTRYHIIRLLGVGGMGAVYHAWDSVLGVAVALKVVRTGVQGDPAAVAEVEKQFKQELLLARQVTHKHVVRIHDLGDIDGIRYITMPYVEGHDLSTILKEQKRLDVPHTLKYVKQIVEGLVAAHEAGVVHRDLKPANIMIDKEDQPLIMDFGIAGSTAKTAQGVGQVVGTLAYMAPEQAQAKPTDQRADVYALGMMIREMLVGRQSTASGEQAVADLMQRIKEAPPSLRAIDETIPEALDALVARCVRPDPAERFQTSAELAAALAALDENGVPIPEPRRFTPRMIAASAAMVVALVAGTWWLTRTPPLPKQHEPVSVLIADFQNQTGDSTFDRSLESVMKLALEGAGFISAYDRTGVRNLGAAATDKLDERTAQEIAVKQGVGVVISGSVDRQGSGYGISVRATQAVKGDVITSATGRASSKDQVVPAATKLAIAIRKALGDETSSSAQIFAMDTLSATSLDVVRQYAVATEALSNGKYEDALRDFSKSVQMDPNFGMGYQGMALVSRNLDKPQDAEKYIKEALRHVDHMTERERYRARGFFYRVTSDYQACVKEYGDLIARYAADVAAHNQLALCSTFLRNMPTAVVEMRQAVKIVPQSAILRGNLALYESYSGNFQAGEREARAVREPRVFPVLALAFGQLGQGKLPEALDTYQKLGALGAQGASYAATGLGDLAVYEGRFSDAVRMLEEGAAADVAAKNPDRAAVKFAALGYAHASRGQQAASAAAAEKALANSQAVNVRFLAARSLVAADQIAKARVVAASLTAEIQAAPQAHGKIIEGLIALKGGDALQAIKTLKEANTLLDTWIGHFDLGRAYLDAKQFIQADSEFDRCLKRRGEALSLFLDEQPTYGYLPPVYYYQGRVREGQNSAGFADSYREYLKIRGTSTEDPLLPDVRRRAGR